jgi:hypothetical protein
MKPPRVGDLVRIHWAKPRVPAYVETNGNPHWAKPRVPAYVETNGNPHGSAGEVTATVEEVASTRNLPPVPGAGIDPAEVGALLRSGGFTHVVFLSHDHYFTPAKPTRVMFAAFRHRSGRYRDLKGQALEISLAKGNKI